MYLSCNIHCKVAEISLPNDHPGELQKVIDTAKGQHTLLIVAVIQSAKRMVRHYLPTPLQATGGCWHLIRSQLLQSSKALISPPPLMLPQNNI